MLTQDKKSVYVMILELAEKNKNEVKRISENDERASRNKQTNKQTNVKAEETLKMKDWRK